MFDSIIELIEQSHCYKLNHFNGLERLVYSSSAIDLTTLLIVRLLDRVEAGQRIDRYFCSFGRVLERRRPVSLDWRRILVLSASVLDSSCQR